eukprot:sb/3476652/
MEKREIIQLFEDKIREKEHALERSLREKSEVLTELDRKKQNQDKLSNTNKNLEEQVCGVCLCEEQLLYVIPRGPKKTQGTLPFFSPRILVSITLIFWHNICMGTHSRNPEFQPSG